MARDPIAALTHSYADAVVHRNGDQWAATWAPDAVWNLGKGRKVEGREAIRALWDGAMDGFAAVIHMILNGTYELDEAAGTGCGRWYIQEHLLRTDGGTGMLLAHYNDEYVRVDGEWLFASRELVPHYAGAPDLSAPFLNAWAPDPRT